MLKTISSYTRLPSSVNGNPRFRFTFEDGSVLDSMSDAGWCYAVGNPELREGSKVMIELTRAGRIRVMREAPATHPKVLHGKCPVCHHYGADCTGDE